MCITLNANELHIPVLSSEDSVLYRALLCIPTAINHFSRSNMTESERTGVQPYIMGSQTHRKWDETAQCYKACITLTCHRRSSDSTAQGGRLCMHINTIKTLAKHYNFMRFTKQSGVK